MMSVTLDSVLIMVEDRYFGITQYKWPKAPAVALQAEVDTIPELISFALLFAT